MKLCGTNKALAATITLAFASLAEKVLDPSAGLLCRLQRRMLMAAPTQLYEKKDYFHPYNFNMVLLFTRIRYESTKCYLRATSIYMWCIFNIKRTTNALNMLHDVLKMHFLAV